MILTSQATADIDGLLAHLREESENCWRIAQDFRHVYPEWLIRSAQTYDAWIAAIEALRTPENVDSPTGSDP